MSATLWVRIQADQLDDDILVRHDVDSEVVDSEVDSDERNILKYESVKAVAEDR
jgi:hypothetical protein